MAHVRAQIRAAVMAKLAAVPGVAAIYGSHAYPHEQLPSIAVLTREETAQEDTRVLGWPDLQLRTLGLEVEIRAAAASALDDALDVLVAEIEAALAGDHTLGGLCRMMVYSGMSMELADGIEPPVALCRLAYEVEYRLLASDPHSAA